MTWPASRQAQNPCKLEGFRSGRWLGDIPSNPAARKPDPEPGRKHWFCQRFVSLGMNWTICWQTSWQTQNPCKPIVFDRAAGQETAKDDDRYRQLDTGPEPKTLILHDFASLGPNRDVNRMVSCRRPDRKHIICMSFAPVGRNEQSPG